MSTMVSAYVPGHFCQISKCENRIASTVEKLTFELTKPRTRIKWDTEYNRSRDLNQIKFIPNRLFMNRPMSIEQVLSSRFFFSLPDGVSSKSVWFSLMNCNK